MSAVHSGITGLINDVISPFGSSPHIGVMRMGRNHAASVESWDTDSWTRAPGTLQFPGPPPADIVISGDGVHLAWIAEFPRLSVQIWSCSTGNVSSTIDLDRMAALPHLVGFIDDSTLLIDRPGPRQTTLVSKPIITQAKPDPAPAPAPLTPRRANIFDDINDPPQPVPVDPQPAPVSPAPLQPNAPTASGEPSEVQIVHNLSIVDINSSQPVRQISLPPLTAQARDAGVSSPLEPIHNGRDIAISMQTKTLAAIAWIDGLPSLVQLDLTTGHFRMPIKISEIDPDQSRVPTGLAYSEDGGRLAALFENGGSALLLVYDSVASQKISSFVYPSGPLEGAEHGVFQGSAVCWLDPEPFWLVYGQGILSTETGAHIKSADLSPADVFAQRHLDGDRVLLVTNTPSGKRVTIQKIDSNQLQTALHAGGN